MRLPAKQALEPISSDPDDPTQFYFNPATAYFYRGRLRTVLGLLDEKPVASLLEVAYGSGIFLPALAQRCARLVALELHGRPEQAQRVVDSERLKVEFVEGSIMALPFADASFDAVTCVSVAEHITDLAAAMAEVHRVLKPGGRAFFGVPVENLGLTTFFRLVGFRYDEDHPQKYPDILAAVRRQFVVEKETRFPLGLPLPFCLYVGLRCRRQDAPAPRA